VLSPSVTNLTVDIMDSAKEDFSVSETPVDDPQAVEKDEDDTGIPARYRGTSADKRDMSMLGKKQVLRVSDLDGCIIWHHGTEPTRRSVTSSS
jgi:hypothetical protein